MLIAFGQEGEEGEKEEKKKRRKVETSMPRRTPRANRDHQSKGLGSCVLLRRDDMFSCVDLSYIFVYIEL